MTQDSWSAIPTTRRAALAGTGFAGELKAFSAVCTHLQCIVDQVASGTIDCP